MPKVTIVVPCFDEADRLEPERFLAFRSEHPEVDFVLVDDGSRDRTLACLGELAERDPSGFRVVALQSNRGKAEAVRAGMGSALQGEAHLVGYWDADLSTSLDEIPRFVAVMEELPEVQIVFGARVQLLGRSIVRSSARHYLGRVFATLVSSLLKLAVYDTQCGAKLFRNSDETRSLFRDPFITNWTFDVEIIARLIRLRRVEGGPDPSESIYELPLDRWRDVAGSKVRPIDFAKALVETVRIYARYLR